MKEGEFYPPGYKAPHEKEQIKLLKDLIEEFEAFTQNMDYNYDPPSYIPRELNQDWKRFSEIIELMWENFYREVNYE